MASCTSDLIACDIDTCNNDCTVYNVTATHSCINGTCVRDGGICVAFGSTASLVVCTIKECSKIEDFECIDYSVINNCTTDLQLYSVGGLINKYNSSITGSNSTLYDFTTYIQNSFHNVINTAENIDNYIPKAEYIRQIDCFSISDDITDEKLVAYKDISLQSVTSTYTQCIPLT